MIVWMMRIEWDYDDTISICATRERAMSELRALIASLYQDDEGYRDDMTEDEFLRWLDVEYGITPDIESFEVLQ